MVLSNDQETQPVQARFAWSKLASPNLINSAGLPTSAFHTHWPDDPALGRNVALGKPHTSSHPNRSGWNHGLTDGRWGDRADSCFATADTPNFPKHATIDLIKPRTIHAVRFGTPGFGGTRTVSVSVMWRDGRSLSRPETGSRVPAGEQ